MSFRSKMRASDSAQSICNAVKGVFGCAVFSPVTCSFTSEKGPQISLLGEVSGYSSSVSFNERSLSSKVPSYTPGERKLFSVMCGDAEQKLSMIYSLLEIINAGSLKNMIVTESASERDSLISSFDLICSFLPGFNVYVYMLDSYDAEDVKESEDEITAFITDRGPSVLIIGRDSLCRNDNLINRADGGKSLSEQIATLHPVVLTVSETIESARSIAAASEVFSPAVTVMFSKEVKKIKSPVIYPVKKAPEESAGNGGDQITLRKK